MRNSLILCSLPLLALAACHAKVDVGDADGNDSESNVHIAMGDGADGNVSVSAPGFNASVSLPNINLSGHVDLDGIKLAPGTKLGGMNVDAHDNGGGGEDSGTVRMSFTNSNPPATVIDHYARSAADAGYGSIVRSATSLTAKKNDKDFAVQIAPEGAGSRGTITITGKDDD